MKVLPKALLETEAEASYQSQGSIQASYYQSCVLGVVSPPDSYEDSVGKIMVKRV